MSDDLVFCQVKIPRCLDCGYPFLSLYKFDKCQDCRKYGELDERNRNRL